MAERPQGGTYSFKDVRAAYSGPFGQISLSDGGVADEGITVAFVEEVATMTTGAGGDWMHSLHASRAGTITVRTLKTSPLNGLFSRLFAFETSTSANYGQGTITVRNPVTGDTFQASGAGLRGMPPNANAKDGGTNEWVFNCGYIDPTWGDGRPVYVAG